MVLRPQRLEAAGALRDRPTVTTGPFGASGRHHSGTLALLAFLPVVWSFPVILELDLSIPGRAGDNLRFLWNSSSQAPSRRSAPA